MNAPAEFWFEVRLAGSRQEFATERAACNAARRLILPCEVYAVHHGDDRPIPGMLLHRYAAGKRIQSF